MKILFFIDCLTSGGKERRLTQLMKSLRAEPGIQFELVVMSNDIHYKEVFEWNIRIHFLIRKTKKDPSVFFKLYKLCKEYKPDLLHCWDSMTAVYAVPVCTLLPVKLVNGMVVDAPAGMKILDKALIRARVTFPFSDLIIGNSYAGLKAYHAPKKKSICIHNGFDFDRINKISDKDITREQLGINTRYIIGMVASFSKWKDYESYFKAAQLLLEKRKDITFLAIGNDTDSAASKKLIEGKYADHFRLLGRRSDVENIIKIMDLCVLSTFTEGISNSIMEYMALEKAVIATRGGGTNEIIEDELTGYMVNPSSPGELLSKMERLLNDEPLRIKMGLAGKQRVAEYFSMERMKNEYIKSYHKLIA